MTKPRTIACPQCGATVEWGAHSRWRPFCSERCKLIDFGGWASEAYRIATTDAPEPVDRGDPSDESRPGRR